MTKPLHLPDLCVGAERWFSLPHLLGKEGSKFHHCEGMFQEALLC